MATADKLQKPLSAQLDAFALILLACLGLVGLHLLGQTAHINRIDIIGLIGLGAIGIFRWTWFIIRVIRSRIYLHWVFPRWRRIADRIPVEDLPPMCFLVPTYQEQDWVTERVFRAIVQEARTLAEPITLLVNSSGDAENAAIRAVLEAEDPNYAQYIRLIQMTQKDGKRKAMADALRELARLGLPPETVIALMDGDSELAPGTLRQCLPFFRMFPRMGALTTDELPVVKGSYMFSEWFHLRFAQRHYQMCSDSLARRVMCLTGRFSLFRAAAALQPSFATQLENDTLDDWLWGRFKFLSGDDKSTWFWLLRRQYEMLYIPDAVVYSIETLSGNVVDRAYQNMRRWYGNMLRNNGRAIAIGPRTTGWFTWYSLIDQRISIWTSLLTPGFLLVSLFQGNWRAAGLILAWVMFSRTLMLWIIFWGRQSYLKLIHFPILLITQWSSSLVKIWTQMNLAKQSWTNRGNQNISAEGTGRKRVIKLGTSRALLFCQLFGFGIVLCWLTGVLNPMWDLAGIWLSQDASRRSAVEVFQAEAGGIIPNDGKDDAKALQALIERLPSDRPVQVELPLGEIDFFHPVEIRRNNLTLKGQGATRTVLQAHFSPSSGEAVLTVKPQAATATAQLVVNQTNAGSQPALKLRGIELSGFSLRLASANAKDSPLLDGILLEDVAESAVKHLSLEQGNRFALILNRTQDIAIEYVQLGSDANTSGIVLRDATNTHTRGVTLPLSSS